MTTMTPDINEILKRPEYNASSSRGAAMGRRNQCDGEPEALHLQRITPEDGDYDTGGAYWGFGANSNPLFCAFSPADTTNDPPVMVFVRADCFATAKAKVLEELKKEGFTFLDNVREVDLFTQHYIKAALWATNDESNDGGGVPLDDNYSEDDFTDEALADIKAECKRFQEENAADITAENCLTATHYVEQAGHDFFLTRNGHGVGFWEDDDWKEEAGERLSEAAKAFGETNIYVGDDGKLHVG
jgi:hypothetical protein